MKKIILTAIVFLLAACGQQDSPSSGGDTTGGAGTGTGTTVTPTGMPQIQVLTPNYLNTTDNAITFEDLSTIPPTTGAIIQAIVADENGDPVEGALVTFSVSAGSELVSTLPTTPTAITSNAGVAQITLRAADAIQSGAGEITASATVGTTAVSGTNNFIVVSVGGGGSTTTAVGGTTSVTASVVDASNSNALITTQPFTIGFSSVCAASGQATIDSSASTTTTGMATVQYNASTCAGSDTITATANINGLTLTAVGTVTIAPDTATTIEFVSATPEEIALQGSGSVDFPETSTVQFRVLGTGSPGLPVANEAVNFSLSTTVGGLSLNNASGTTNADGLVDVVVQAGNLPTSVEVRAEIAATRSKQYELKCLSV